MATSEAIDKDWTWPDADVRTDYDIEINGRMHRLNSVTPEECRERVVDIAKRQGKGAIRDGKRLTDYRVRRLGFLDFKIAVAVEKLT